MQELITIMITGWSALEPVAIALARVGVGLMFAISGWHKLFVPARQEQLYKTLKRANIPCARIQTPFVATVEFLGGACVTLGCLTPLAALGLLIISVVAIAVDALDRVAGSSPSTWLENFLYLPEVLYVLVLFWLVTAGGGPLSVDALLLDRLLG